MLAASAAGLSAAIGFVQYRQTQGVADPADREPGADLRSGRLVAARGEALRARDERFGGEERAFEGLEFVIR
jgi:hypothetical protein